MLKFISTLFVCMISLGILKAELPKELEVEQYPLYPSQVIVPKSKLGYQVLFVGGQDMVQTTPTYGNAAGAVPAKQWHDFIGFTPASAQEGGLGWVSVNHEMIYSDDNIGDGGGMTSFKIEENSDGTLKVVDQTIVDPKSGVTRTGKFFNVDFVNYVGETGMNCGGINSEDGRIWTAEEWWQSSNAGISSGFRDTSDFTISAPEFPFADGQTIKKVQNLNWMVEVDPKKAIAIRKQYNWGRLPFEGGAIANDNKTVYFGPDDTPAPFTKFVADVEGDFTKGKLYMFVQNEGQAAGTWVEIDNSDWDTMLDLRGYTIENGASMFNRLEWVAYDKFNDVIYMTETGRDNPGSRLKGGFDKGGKYATHHVQRATEQGTTVDSDDYWDYYGRVLRFDPKTNELTVFIEGGPYYELEYDGWQNQEWKPLPNKHLSNPDGLNVMYIKGKSYLVIMEDLNGLSYGRMHPGIDNPTCEMWITPLESNQKTANIDDLVRIAATPIGAEITGACPVYNQNGETIALLVNSQHPDAFNAPPYHNSLTFALTGWEDAISSIIEDGGVADQENSMKIYPNPTSRELNFGEMSSAALYDMSGKRIKVVRNTNRMDIMGINPGVYFLKFENKPDLHKVIIER